MRLLLPPPAPRKRTRLVLFLWTATVLIVLCCLRGTSAAVVSIDDGGVGQDHWSPPVVSQQSSGRREDDASPPASTQFVEDEERLLVQVFREYNHLVRPVRNQSERPVQVDFGVAMILLINVDEKNQIMQTNVWLTMKWHDFQLQWNPADFGGITNIRVPTDRVWQPDIVLFNNADGNYEVSFKSNVFIEHTGMVTWVPPAIYKSSCRIDVEFFPFDEQTCHLIFGSWTYNADEVVLSWYHNHTAVQLTEYSYSGIWDVIDAPGVLVHRPRHKESKIVFHIQIRRKPLFFSAILIAPTVLMAFLSTMAFYLPTDSAEKISLVINLLLALVVFLLLVSKILPPTSNIPLMGKYLLMTFILNIVTIVVTVIIVNVYFRSARTHSMPDWARRLFLELLPRLLLMRRPERIPIFNGYFVEEYCAEQIFDASLVMPSVAATIVPFMRTAGIGGVSPGNGPATKTKKARKSISQAKGLHQSLERAATWETDEFEERGDDSRKSLPRQYSQFSQHHHDCAAGRSNQDDEVPMTHDMRATIDSIAYIADHMKREMSDKKTRDDWKYMAQTIDRLLLLVFFGVTLGGTFGILLSAPHVFDFIDQEAIIRRLNARSQETAATETTTMLGVV